MKNKRLMIAGTLVVATALFTVGVFASPNAQTGYEALKDILKSNQAEQETVKNGTFAGKYSLSDNGKVMVSVSGTGAFDEASKQASGHIQIQANDLSREANFYGSDQKVYFEDLTNGLNYQMTPEKSSENESDYRGHFGKEGKQDMQGMSKTGEAFMDFLMGDLKNEVEMSANGDGSKTFTLDLNQNEIPLIIQTLASEAITDKSNHDDWKDQDSNKHDAALEQMKKMPFFNGLEDIHNQVDISKLLTSNIVINNMSLQVTVDADNQLKSMTGALAVSGLDSSGTAHDVVLTGNGEVSQLNTSTVKVFDPNGKVIETIDTSKFE